MEVVPYTTVFVLICLNVPGFLVAQAQPVALTVARTSSELDLADRLAFPEVVVNIGNAWNRSSNELVIPSDSIYFFHVNAGANTNKRVNMNLRGNYNTDALRISNNHNGIDTLGRDFISSASVGVPHYVGNEFTFELYSDDGRQTSYTAFDLQAYLNTSDPTIFCVNRRQNTSAIGEIMYTERIVNLGGSWDEASDRRFNVTEPGLYLFTLSAGLRPNTGVRTQLKSQMQGMLSELWRSSTTHNGVDTISKSIMADLEAGDSLFVELLQGQLFSDAERQTSFCGFRYEPVSGIKVAWSVYGTLQWTASDEPIDPLPFNGNLVNTNNMFHFSDNRVYIQQSGVYFVSLSVGVLQTKPVDAYIVRSLTTTEAKVWKSSSSHNGVDTISTALLLRLEAGNTLRVILGPGSMLFSNSNRQTTFTGFLLHPE